MQVNDDNFSSNVLLAGRITVIRSGKFILASVCVIEVSSEWRAFVWALAFPFVQLWSMVFRSAFGTKAQHIPLDLK